MTWNPKLYLKFERERTQPAIDLAARVELAEPKRIIDLGCGPGNSTAVLRARWPSAAITGLDSDPAMIAAARETDTAATWIQGDAGTWQTDAKFDLVFSNALLQWLPDHEAVIETWFKSVARNGALAVQIPVNFGSPVHRHILEVADDLRWKDQIGHARRTLYAKEPTEYYDILSSLTPELGLWVTEYCHVLEGPDEIVNWMRGTGLRPFLNALPTDEDRAAFETALLERVTASYPRQTDGKVIFPFRRLFFVAYR